ncbi:MAG: iron ABC transporter permease [Planctomycetes bacterium]|nr:iron ABC transporter permease [Planctomycetota bacterium]
MPLIPRSGPPARAGMRMGDFIPPALAIILVLLMAIFLLIPIGMAISSAFEKDGHFSLEWFAMVTGSRLMIEQMLRSVLLACATTALCLVLALPLAVLRARTSFFGQGLLGILLLVPMILPPFVGAMSMRRLLCQFGSLNLLLEKIGLLDFSRALPPDWLGGGLAGVVILQALHLFPILYLNASAAMANIDPAYPQAARNLGAGPWRTFFSVTLPLMRPGLFAGATIIFIWSLTDIGTPLIMGYEQLTAVTIFKELGRGNYFGWTYSLVFIMLSGSVTLYVLGKFIFGRSHAAESSKATVSADVRRLGAAGTLGAWLMFGVVIMLAVLPHVGVALMAFSDRWVNTVLPSQFTFKHIAFVLSDERTYSSIVNSLKYAAGSTAIDIVLGGLAAWLIIRCRVRGKTLLDGLMMLPLAVPGLILAAGYVALTNWHPPSWLPAWLSLEAIGPTKNPTWLLIIAYAVRRVPFVVRGVSAGLEQVPVSLEEAARNLGASQLGAAWRITVPLVAANIIAAGVLTFAFAVLEVSDSLILAQTEQYYPITKQIYNLATSAGFPQTANQAAALGVYGMAMLAGTMAIASALLGKRLGAIFRA